MKYCRDIMQRQLTTLSPQADLKQAERLMAQQQIRHIPVVDEQQRLCGLLTQKEFLTEAFRITDRFGAHLLNDYLARTELSTCMNAEPECISADSSLVEAGERLLARKQGCLLVIDENQILQGIITSRDFMRLALTQLQQQEAELNA